jgi:hypothetical protein
MAAVQILDLEGPIQELGGSTRFRPVDPRAPHPREAADLQQAAGVLGEGASGCVVRPAIRAVPVAEKTDEDSSEGQKRHCGAETEERFQARARLLGGPRLRSQARSEADGLLQDLFRLTKHDESVEGPRTRRRRATYRRHC